MSRLAAVLCFVVAAPASAQRGLEAPSRAVEACPVGAPCLDDAAWVAYPWATGDAGRSIGDPPCTVPPPPPPPPPDTGGGTLGGVSAGTSVSGHASYVRCAFKVKAETRGLATGGGSITVAPLPGGGAAPAPVAVDTGADGTIDITLPAAGGRTYVLSVAQASTARRSAAAGSASRSPALWLRVLRAGVAVARGRPDVCVEAAGAPGRCLGD